MTTPEGKVKAKLNKLLSSYDKLYVFKPVPVMYQARSVDYLLCYLGRFIAIETKPPTKKKPTAIQGHTLRRIEAAGGLTFIVYDDETMDNLKQTLDHLY